MRYVNYVLLNEFKKLLGCTGEKCDAFPVFNSVHYLMLRIYNNKYYKITK